MSRAFVKDDAPDGPPIIPARAPLPAGVPNYVTPRGQKLLLQERVTLEAERTQLSGGDIDDAERQRQLAIVTGKLSELSTRISTAQVVKPKRQDRETVRFGASVRLLLSGQTEKTLQIVGVDEAYADDDRVAFTSPIARAVTGKKVGETGTMRTPQGESSVSVMSVSYDG